jgi:hypothetical protein
MKTVVCSTCPRQVGLLASHQVACSSLKRAQTCPSPPAQSVPSAAALASPSSISNAPCLSPLVQDPDRHPWSAAVVEALEWQVLDAAGYRHRRHSMMSPPHRWSSVAARLVLLSARSCERFSIHNSVKWGSSQCIARSFQGSPLYMIYMIVLGLPSWWRRPCGRHSMGNVSIIIA